jgi:hypothetical protein
LTEYSQQSEKSFYGALPSRGLRLAGDQGIEHRGFYNMGEVVFELEYIDRLTGVPMCKEVSGLGLAQKLAKELAIASGRRAIIRRKRTAGLWTVHIADTKSGEVTVLWKGLTKREAMLRWKLWKERRTECVLVAWPEWLPQPSIGLVA